MTLCGAVIDLTNLEVRVLLTQNGGLPPTVNVVLQAACAHEAQAILLAHILKFYCNVFIHKKLV